MTDPKNSLNEGNIGNGVQMLKKKESTINTLKLLCKDNAEYFATDSTENGQRLYISFLAMIDSVTQMWPKVEDLEENVARYDFDERTPANGYRSFLLVSDLAVQLAVDLNEKVLQKRDSVLFRKSVLTKDVESCSHLIVSLDSCLGHLKTMLSWSEDNNLFIKDDFSIEELIMQFGQVNQHCFYGRNLGFQFCDSIRNVLKIITTCMTLFSEVYYNEGSLISRATTSVMSMKYITDPEQRARRIVNISQNAEVDFCKAFWFMSETELVNQLPSIVSPSVAISKLIHLPPEPLFVTTADGREIEIPVPSSYLGKKPLQLRLISHKLRSGMIGTKNNTKVEPACKGLLFHCHGGGFVAQSSKSHEGYLRDWAKDLDIPILCVDYSLAPEAPYPRALEEVLYAYCWARKNFRLLGSTGEIIVGAGDSAGANLLLSSTLKCINMNIPTLKGLFVAYAPTLVHYTPSPARLLCLMDPMIPFGFLMRCLKAYACPDENLKKKRVRSDSNSDTESFEEISESDLMELQAHKSPVSDTSDTLTYGSLMSNDVAEENTKAVNLNDSDIEEGQKYMSDLLEKYVLDSDTETDGTKISLVTQETASSSNTADNSIQKKVTSFLYNLKGQFTEYLGSRTMSPAEKLLDLDIDPRTNLINKFAFNVPKDPYLSPLYAEDDDLRLLPPTHILSTHFDPCLDDCVMFSKRLKNLGNNVKLDVLESLPHGFLNFSLFSREAYEGSKVCIQRIQELLKEEQ
ncbi:hormone-sensitive lipase [Leptinotarsa decemlineata]|uniref:hormone-sensitive lipase n=1 Tax=Leptinotarsa decemlineata TaxID=7539 RepID=UPI003D30D35C